MATHVHLLGPPCVVVDGRPVQPPRGSKSWCLLAYLLLTHAPVPRSRLAGLLFDGADDPAGALRWTLSQARRALGPEIRLDGDPLTGVLRPGTVVDADVVARGSWQDAVALPGFGRELLEGVPLRVGPAFELWLSNERRRIAGTTRAMLHEATHARLARGEAPAAADLASRLVAGDPLDEGGHELLVRSLVAVGDRRAAEWQAARCRDLFRRELGVDPSPALSAALRVRTASPRATTRGAVLAQVETGRATARAGAYEVAVDLLRSGVSDARRLGHEDLLGHALAALGGALVEGVRGADEEGIAVLHEAVVLARRTGDRATASRAAVELGYIEVLRGRYPRMESWLRQAREFADCDPRLLVWAEVHAGFGRIDQADYPAAVDALDHAVRLAEEAGDGHALAYAWTGIGRLRLLRRELGAAREALTLGCEVARRLDYTSFLAFPESLLGEVYLLDGQLEEAAEALEHSYALACQVGDPCWQGYSLRARGLVAAARREDAPALDCLVQAREACRRARSSHDWVQAYCLDALCAFAAERGLDAAPQWVAELEDFASRRGLWELLARAVMHRAQLGQPGADGLAALLLQAVDNPWLREQHRGRAGSRAARRPVPRSSAGHGLADLPQRGVGQVLVADDHGRGELVPPLVAGPDRRGSRLVVAEAHRPVRHPREDELDP
ncbi:AfsR/SARP family transcriptional regulator [Trujillonella endophytica]|uniref:DNA-binding transcriptional activator of the SARP family n=1 Tax=Trujillonella endophytica TaxID=673521 RepID=A0A1H8PBV5_9ACTN|nr:BTAD domain-containing putative transcriptional regulator [Trujillella endophytica]SEO39174.1 DNA-binding transcriptional activator of the SARP family [Trujillella endophytica]